MRAAVRLCLVIAGAAVALGAASSAWADEFSDRRASCDPVMTVLRADCGVENAYACPDGTRYHESIRPDGTSGSELSDADYGLLYSIDHDTGDGLRRIVEARRAMSLRELLSTGRSSGDYIAEGRFGGSTERAHATFDLQLTSESRTIDGISMQVAHAVLGIGPEGGGMATIDGTVLIDASRNLLLTDVTTATVDGDVRPNGSAIVGLVAPGQPGFMALQPSDCLDQTSSLSSPEPPHG